MPPLPGELTGGFRSSMGTPTKNRATARDEALSKALLPSIPRSDGWPGRNPQKKSAATAAPFPRHFPAAG